MKRTALFKKLLNSMSIAFVAILGISTTLTAQNTINTTVGSTGYTGTNSAGNGFGITFVVNNTTNDPIILTDVGDWTQSSDNGTTFTLYYSSTSLGGTPATSFPAAGWTQVASSAVSGITNSALSVNNVLSNMTLQIPANTMYRFSLVTSGARRYSGTGVGSCTPDSFLNNGVYLYVGDYQISGGYVGYGATNNPRFFTGSITFIPALPCTAPPVAGAASASTHTPCLGQNVELSTVGASFGLGLTYQWQSGSTSTGPFTNIAGATNPLYNFTTSTSGTTYYRLGLTCSGQTSYSTPDSVVVPVAFPGGTYTVNPALAPSSTNFTSVAAAFSAMNCGISGSIILNLAPGNTFNEQVTIASTIGTNATKTVTINGNADTLTFNGSVNLPWTLGLNGADYITVNNLVIQGTNTSYALVAHLWNDADNNSFNNCKFLTMPNVTSSTTVPFSVSGSPISATTAGASGSGNVLDGCTMFGGYYSTCFYGPSTTVQSTGNKVLNSTLSDFYFYGSYNVYQSGLEIRKNHVSRPTRTTLSSFYGIYLSSGISNAIVEKNWIENQFGGNTTYSGTVYNIYVSTTSATVGNEIKIFNNVIGNVNGSGTNAGIYLPSTTNVQVYNNTVSIDNTLATTGTVYGIYSTGATNVDIQNNNISVTQGGTGTKYCIYFSGLGKTSNHNNLYMGSTSGTSNNVGYYSGVQATLAAWQAANSGAWDQASVSIDPIFVSPTTGNFTPTNAALNNLGTPLAAITTDFLGTARNATTPDIGAFEFSVSGCTGTVTAGSINNAPTMNVCAGVSISLNVTGASIPAGGITYQWQQRVPAGTGPWTNISGANATTLNLPTGITVPTDFRFYIACSLSSSSDTTGPIALNLNPGIQCYCTPTYTYGCSNGATLESFSTSGATTNISNLNTGCVGTGYTSYTSMVASAIQSSSFTATTAVSNYSGGVKIWIDWNQDGNFDPVTELVAASTATIASGSSFTETITVPLTALPGTTRMRVRVVESSTTFGPCDLANYGETEDYGFNVVQVAACTNPPSAGVLSGIDSICPSISFTLSSTGVTLASGMTYQWQSGATATGPWTNITGATAPSYTASTGITAATYYRLSVQCGTGAIVYSASKKVSVKGYIDCYCIPTYTYNCSSGDDIKDVILAGSVAPGINNLNTPCPTTGYQDYSATMSATLIAGNTYSGNVTTSYTSASENVRIWIDYNQNGVFDSVETIGVIANISNLSTGAYTFTVPATVAAGTYKMRVRLVYSGNAATIDPCSLESFGETHDYKIIIQSGTTCTNPVVNLGADTTICAGQTLTLNAGAANATFTKLWSNAATTQTINVTTAGTYSVTVTDGTCVGKDTIVVGVTPLPVVNLGADTAICAGSTLTLSAGAANATYTKLWSNLATTQTIPVTTAGTYSVKVTNGACSKSDTIVVTVNPLPVVNLGADTGICTGSTLTLDAGNAGATYLWSDASTAQTLAVTAAGTYGVTVTKNGCSATDSIAVTATAPPTVGGITATGTAPNFVFTANGATNVTTYAWTFGDGGTSGATAPQHDYVQTNVDQTFTVTLIVSNACGSDTVTTTVVVPKSTGVNNLQLNAKELKLYPNPAQQLVTVENDSKLKMKQIKITNILGQEVARIAVTNQAKQTINVANLAAGIYNVTIEFEEGTVNRKLEILK